MPFFGYEPDTKPQLSPELERFLARRLRPGSKTDVPQQQRKPYLVWVNPRAKPIK